MAEALKAQHVDDHLAVLADAFTEIGERVHESDRRVGVPGDRRCRRPPCPRSYRPGDLTTDERWPEYGRRVAALGLRSMLSYRMNVGPLPIGGLNIYSDQVDAFDDTAAAVGLLLATHGAIAASAVAHRTHAEQLEHALASNRRIGAAIGILMAMHKVTEKQAFDLLRIASQNTNRKLRDVAEDVIECGTLDVVSPLRDA